MTASERQLSEVYDLIWWHAINILGADHPQIDDAVQFAEFSADEADPWLEARDAAIVELLYGCGLRISELCGLRAEDVDWNERIVRVTIPFWMLRMGRENIKLGSRDRLVSGSVSFHLHESGERIGIRIRDANSPLRRAFKGLRWFPVGLIIPVLVLLPLERGLSIAQVAANHGSSRRRTHRRSASVQEARTHSDSTAVSTSASVEGPLLVRFSTGSCCVSKRIDASCRALASGSFSSQNRCPASVVGTRLPASRAAEQANAAIRRQWGAIGIRVLGGATGAQ